MQTEAKRRTDRASGASVGAADSPGERPGERNRGVTMIRNLFAAATLGIVLSSQLLVLPLRADEWDKQTNLTINAPVSIAGTVLTPGKYVLKLLDSDSDREVVQIFNRYQTHLITTVHATAVERLEPTGKPVFSFYETAPGHTMALRSYFYPGDEDGLMFPKAPEHK